MEENELKTMDTDVLNGEKNTKSESDGLNAAKAMYILGIVMVWLVLIVGFILSIKSAHDASQVQVVRGSYLYSYTDTVTDYGAGVKAFFATFLLYACYAVALYIFTKAVRSVIVLLVNISATLKRMEINKSVEQTIQKAKQGDAEAQYQLASYYSEGNLVKQNKEEAAKWCLKAAEQGHVEAMCKIGLAYLTGDSVERNREEAANWLKKATDQGSPETMCIIGMAYYNDEGGEKNKEEAVKWFMKAADKGNVEAQYRLGVCYGRGEGVEQNKDEAVKWLNKAGEQGHDGAWKAKLSVGLI